MKKSTKIIIAVVSVILVAAIVFAVLFFTTDLFKTKNPKKAFYEYLDKATKVKDGEAGYSDMLAKLTQYQDKSYEGKGNISMDIELGSMMKTDEVENIVKILNNAEINYETKADPKNSNSYTAMNIKYNGKDLGTAELAITEDELGIKVKDIYDKYLTLTFEEIMEKLQSNTNSSNTNMSLDMSKMENIDINELVDILDISSDELNRIKDRYKKVLEDSIPEKNYSTEKEKITVNGKEINATAYIVEISQEDLVNLAKNILESLKDDTETIDLVVEKVNKLMKLYGEDSIKLSKSDVKSVIESALSELKDIKNLKDTKAKIVLYGHKDETVRFKFAIGDEEIIIDSLKDGDKTNMALKVKAEGTEMTIMNIEQTKKGDNSYTTKLSTDLSGLKLEITIDTEMTDSNAKENMTLYVEMQSVVKATLNINSEIEYKSVNIDKLSSSNSISAMNITETEQLKLGNGLLNYLDKNMDTIKDIANTLGYEDEIEELEDNLNSLKSSQTNTTPDDTADDVDNNDDAA